MRPLDLFVEKQACDRSVDSSISRILAKDITDPVLREQLDGMKTLTSKDKVSIASASVALGSPFLFMGLGAAFMMMDQFDQQRQQREVDQWTGANRPAVKGGQDLSVLGTLDKEIMGVLTAPTALAALDRVNPRGGAAKKESAEAKYQSVFKGLRRGDNGRFLAEGQDWLKTSKLLKQKFFLMDEVERVNGQADYSETASLIAQIEKLDKALKRLGC